jgi:hypothetical protein
VRRPATLRQLKGATGQRRDAGHERGTSAPRQTEQYRGEIGSASSGGVIGLAMPSKRTTEASGPSRADRAAECRLRAIRCAELATTATTSQLKATLLDLSKNWLRLGESLEKTHALMVELHKL